MVHYEGWLPSIHCARVNGKIVLISLGHSFTSTATLKVNKKFSYQAYHGFTCAQIIRINHLVHILKAKASNIFAYTVLKNYIRKSGASSKIRLG